MSMPAALFIVATPIGNLDDISLRALETLKNVDLIAAEDTRHSARLLQRFDIKTKMLSYHDHSDERQTAMLLDKLKSGLSIALVSDAGTPLISDPGYPLVKAARKEGLRVVPIPGACAVIAALCASGLSSYQFSFEGFAPAKAVARKQFFESREHDERTLIYYESPHRIVDCLNDIKSVFGAQRSMVLAREITKTFETFLSGNVQEVLEQVLADTNQTRGEMVLLIEGYKKEVCEGVAPDAQQTMKVLMAALPLKQAATLCAKLTGEKKNKLYQWGVEQKDM